MAPQSLDLGLSLGLGMAAFQPSFCHPGNAAVAAAAEREASPDAAEERERRCSPAGSPVSSGSGSGKRAAAERSSGSGSSDEGDDGAARKKLRLSKDQAAVLEECFKTHHTLTPVSLHSSIRRRSEQGYTAARTAWLIICSLDRSPVQKQKVALASSLALRPRQVEVWFQNRRARTKLKQTEVDCEYLKRWCERLADENKRLEKELADLRALKAAPSPAAQPASPAATLTMCPCCRRVAATAATPTKHQQQQQCHPKSSSSLPAAAAGGACSVVPSHCQFFPAAVDRTSQSTWNTAAPLVTRELF